MSAAEELVTNLQGQLEHTAYHEAGHAAAAISLGLEVCSVTVERQSGFRGRTHVHFIDDAARNAAVCLAGPEASRRWCSDDWKYGMEGDFDAAAKFIDQAAGNIHDLGLSAFARRRATITLRAKATVEQLVVDHWPEIQMIARALLEAKALRGAEVARIYEASFGARGGHVWR